MTHARTSHYSHRTTATRHGAATIRQGATTATTHLPLNTLPLPTIPTIPTITTTTAHDDVHATTLTHARRRAHRLNYY